MGHLLGVKRAAGINMFSWPRRRVKWTVALVAVGGMLAFSSLAGYFRDVYHEHFQFEKVEEFSELPVGVISFEGQLSLWADFDQAHDDQVPLYLINRTAEILSFHSQDGDFYLKLERWDEKRGWERVQSHIYSDCGNSYGAAELPPGMFTKLVGYMPKEGTRARVRFNGYGDREIVSNIDEGRYRQTDLEQSRIDQMSIRMFPRSIQSVFADNSRSLMDVKSSPTTLLTSLSIVRGFNAAYQFRAKAREQLRVWRQEKQSSEINGTLNGIESLLEGDWTVSSEPVRQLWLQCIDALEDDASGKVFLNQDARFLVWVVLQELVYGRSIDAYPGGIGSNYSYDSVWTEESIPLSREERERLLAVCRSAVIENRGSSHKIAVSLIASVGLAGDLLNEKELIDFVVNPQMQHWHWAGVGLVGRGLRDELISAVSSRSEEDHFHVLWMTTRQLGRELTPIEVDFHERLFSLNAGKYGSYLLNRYGYEPHAIPETYRDGIVTFLREKLRVPPVTTDWGNAAAIGDALRVVSRWEAVENDDLIREFWDYPTTVVVFGEHDEDGGAGTKMYPIRDTARGLLMN